MNYTNNAASADSYDVEVLNASGKTARQFVTDYYGGIEAGPSEISDVTINKLPAVKFFMEKAMINDHGGSANILFLNNTTAVTISSLGKTGTTSEIMNDSTRF